MHVLIPAVSSAKHPTGICRHAASLARCLVARDEISKVTLVTRTEQAAYFNTAFELSNHKLTMMSVSVRGGPITRNHWYLNKLPEVAARCSPDIVHLSFPAPFVRRRFPCPVVTSLHDLYPFDIPANSGMSKMIFQRFVVGQCLRSSDGIVCGSDFTLSRLRAIDPKADGQKVVRIYQCVESRTAAAQAPALPFPRDTPFLLCVAQHRSNKNLHLLLRAFAHLLSANYCGAALTLVIVGADGPETPSLTQLVDHLKLRHRVAFISSITDSDLIWLYRSCELFVLPSSIEGFGLPLVEALQCGCRVICSDIPVFREIAGAAVRYVDLRVSFPAQALARAISLARQEPHRCPEGMDRFSPNQVSSQYVALYSRLLAIKTIRLDLGACTHKPNVR